MYLNIIHLIIVNKICKYNGKFSSAEFKWSTRVLKRYHRVITISYNGTMAFTLPSNMGSEIENDVKSLKSL